MNDRERVEGWFREGRLLRPLERPTTADLAQAIASVCGADGALSDHARRIASSIGEPDNLVFVLADGFGMNLIDELSATSPLRTDCVANIDAVFPSSTAPALTSLATGLWPAAHSLLFWWIYMAESDVSVITLPFIERLTHRPLGELGITGEQLFREPPLVGSYRRDVLSLQPHQSSESVYTRYYTARTPVHGYESLEEAIDVISQRVLAATAPTYTYLYFSGIDHAEHEYGPGSPETRAQLFNLSDEVRRLSEAIGNRARIVISADHGQFEVTEAANRFVETEDELLEFLLCAPTGEGPEPAFHVRPGHSQAFEACFRRRFGDEYALLHWWEVEEMQLLGPGPLTEITRARLGDYLGLTADPVVLRFRPEPGIAAMKGDHGGLSPAEIEIPLIVI